MGSPGSSPGLSAIDAHSNYSFRINLAHLVEQLSVKQFVVGSNPTVYSFASSIRFNSSVGRAIH